MSATCAREIYGAGFESPRSIPIPAGAVASPPIGEDSDNHLCIIDRTKHLEWGMWAARQDRAGRWFTGLGAVTDLSGTASPHPGSRPARARLGPFPRERISARCRTDSRR